MEERFRLQKDIKCLADQHEVHRHAMCDKVDRLQMQIYELEQRLCETRIELEQHNLDFMENRSNCSH